jgi:hypothetical protein
MPLLAECLHHFARVASCCHGHHCLPKMKTQHTTNTLLNSYFTCLLVICMDFITQNGLSIQLIDATSIMEKWIESIVADKLR